MKKLSDIRFQKGHFFRKNDKLAILNFINETPALFKKDNMVGETHVITHHRTYLSVHIIGCGIFSVQKSVDKGANYTYNSYLNLSCAAY